MSIASKYHVVVVIVNWERPKDTIECVYSVLDNDIPAEQIILVDNGSQDDSIKKFRTSFPQVKLVTLRDNLGFSGGYNAGLDHALTTKATHIMVLNNDTIIERGAVQSLLNTPWDVSVPKILLHDEPNRIWAAGARWRSCPPSVTMIGFGKKDTNAYNQPHQLDFATGCALMIKREVFNHVNGFDDNYINYMEDYDFSYRVREAGFTIGYQPEAIVLHKVSQTLGENSPERWWYLGRNIVLFYRKDNRFAGWKLSFFLAWFIMRESLKGKIKYLGHFLRGTREGLSILSDYKQDQGWKK